MGLRIAYYPTRLSDDDVDFFGKLALASYDAAPFFCGWLLDVMHAEQIRRLKTRNGQPAEVDVPRLPLDWPAAQLGLALHAATALSYDPPSYTAGRFADELVKSINAIAAHRLEAMA